MEQIEKIVENIIEECAAKGETVSEALAGFVFKTVALKHDDKAYFGKDHDEDIEFSKLNQMKSEAVEMLLRHDCSQMSTIRLQVSFDLAFSTIQMSHQNKIALEQEYYNQFIKQICEIALQYGLEFEIINSAYETILDFLVFTCHERFCEHVTEIPGSRRRAIRKEILTCLQSILPKLDLKEFLTNEESKKVSQLDELCSIVAGLRIFNKATNKGGLDLEDRFEHLTSIFPALELQATSLKEDSNFIKNTINDLSLVGLFLCKSKSEIDLEKLKNLKSTLVLAAQFSSFLAFALQLYEDTYQTVSDVLDVNKNEIAKLRKIFKATADASKAEVYPRFDLLGRAFIQIGETLRQIETFKVIAEILLDFKSKVSHQITLVENAELISEAKKCFLQDNSTRSFKELLSEGSNPAHDSQEMKHSSIASIPNLVDDPQPSQEDISFEYDGFCPVTLVNFEGLLLKGKRELGIMEYNSKFFTFYTSINLQLFKENPEYFIKAIQNLMKSSPELINLVAIGEEGDEEAIQETETKMTNAESIPKLCKNSLYTSFARSQRMTSYKLKSSDQNMQIVPEEKSGKVDSGTMTSLHFVESYIDPNYEWNAYKIRYNFFRLANLVRSKAKTVSIQTEERRTKRHFATQMYLPKESETQTPIPKRVGNPLKFSQLTMNEEKVIETKMFSIPM